MTERQSNPSRLLHDMLPIPLKDWKAKHGFNNPQTALFFGFSTPAIQKMLTGDREIGVLEVGEDCFKIVETKKTEVLILCPSVAYKKRNGRYFFFEQPEAFHLVQIVEPRGPRKTKDAEG